MIIEEIQEQIWKWNDIGLRHADVSLYYNQNHLEIICAVFADKALYYFKIANWLKELLKIREKIK